jgi:hypothetical protein
MTSLYLHHLIYPHHLEFQMVGGRLNGVVRFRTYLNKINEYLNKINVSGPSKSQDFVPGSFRINELVPFSDLAG